MFKKKKHVQSSPPQVNKNFTIQEKIVVIDGKKMSFPVKVYDSIEPEESQQLKIDFIDIDDVKISTED